MTNSHRPFQLLEITLVSAQELAPISKCMRTYALTWVHTDRKLTTKVDQHGNTDPQWNEKFVFRVDEAFLNSEDSSIEIEIYAAAWLRDVLIGSVRAPVGSLFPSHVDDCSKLRYVSLQVRRPSGRPQGILNMGVQLLDNTIRSMPLSDLGSSIIVGQDGKEMKPGQKGTLRRAKSDLTDVTSSAQEGKGGKKGPKLQVGSSVVGSSVIQGEQNYNDQDYNDQCNGSLLGSDLGPSASVVAAAIAKGLIKTPRVITLHGDYDQGSSVLQEWVESESIDGLKTKLDRWRNELPPVYDNEVRRSRKAIKRRKRQRRRRRQAGLFTCMGNICGCEISISCGGGSGKKNYNKARHNGSSVAGHRYLL